MVVYRNLCSLDPLYYFFLPEDPEGKKISSLRVNHTMGYTQRSKAARMYPLRPGPRQRGTFENVSRHLPDLLERMYAEDPDYKVEEMSFWPGMFDRGAMDIKSGGIKNQLLRLEMRLVPLLRTRHLSSEDDIRLERMRLDYYDIYRDLQRIVETYRILSQERASVDAFKADFWAFIRKIREKREHQVDDMERMVRAAPESILSEMLLKIQSGSRYAMGGPTSSALGRRAPSPTAFQSVYEEAEQFVNVLVNDRITRSQDQSFVF